MMPLGLSRASPFNIRASERTTLCENFRKLDIINTPLKENVITWPTIYVSELLCL